MEVSKTLDPSGAEIRAQETDAHEGFSPFSQEPAAFAPSRPEGLEPSLQDDSAAAPVRQSQNAGPRAILQSWVAVDPLSIRLLEEIPGIARSASTVLVRAENGAGKNLLAALLHYLGPQAQAPLVSIDCASLPRDLLEVELFGREDGLASSKIGLLEMAGAGTLVLDEIAALTMPMQAKLLRVIDEKRFERVNGARSVETRARIVALTSVDLEHAVARRTFREDLYYRLNVIPVVVPPLRDRPADIVPLAEFFLARLAEIHRKPRLRLAPAAMVALEHYSYPGNVRELRNIVERAIAVAQPPELLLQDLPAHVRSAAPARQISLEELERAHIAEVLAHTQGRKTRAAQILGISRKTLLEKRKRYGLE